MVKIAIESQGKKGSDRYDSHCSNSQVNPDLVKKIKGFIRKNNVSEEDAKDIFNDRIVDIVLSGKDSVPIEIFSNRELGAFESIVKYLKENLCESFSEISSATERSVKTVWTAYSKSRIKRPSAYSIKKSSAEIPLSVFRNRSLGVQENLVIYLKDSSGFSYHDIASALKRDDRTIWTAYHRAKKKSGESGAIA
ncbi:MAG: hypothetical protein NT001_02410 [Candidatus Woesearchaeota archaeon]|nr:hypothetical protein [Candidatus Woesearchaeota archaeon]